MRGIKTHMNYKVSLANRRLYERLMNLDGDLEDVEKYIVNEEENYERLLNRDINEDHSKSDQTEKMVLLEEMYITQLRIEYRLLQVLDRLEDL